ncbi:MAG: hypothetical protein NVS3B10_25510 [Polyangiales bacterium]
MCFGKRAAARVGLDTLTPAEWESHFARFEPLPGNLPAPLALRYHGHQFDVYNPQLGDGRGFLFAQLLDAQDDRLLDLGTKGSGRTPWSRGGDGKLTLKGGVREILATELLEALAVPTSKTFSLFETGEALMRGDEPSPTRSSVLVRLSHSHVRFGTFQRLAYLDDAASTQRLFEYVVENFFPACATPAALLGAIVARTADLCAAWMVAGFVHGVLNSDNMNVTGESFDYGPFRFLPRYDPAFTAAYFDHAGLYAFGRQPEAVLRNLVRLAEALTPIAPRDELGPSLRSYEAHLGESVRRRMLARLGVASVGVDEDAALVGAAFDLLETTKVGYERFFFDWYGGVASERRAQASPEHEAYRGAEFDLFRAAIERHAPREAARLAHPYFARRDPCTLLIDEVEALWARIAVDDDWSALDAKVVDIRAMGDALGDGVEEPTSGSRSDSVSESD